MRPSVRTFLLGFGPAVVLGVVSAAAAQSRTQDITPPKPAKEESPPIVLNYLAAVVIVGAAVGACLIPSKRGHQD